MSRGREQRKERGQAPERWGVHTLHVHLVRLRQIPQHRERKTSEEISLTKNEVPSSSASK